MSKVDLVQNNFNAGEYSPRMHGRSDFQRYRDAGEIVENLFVLAQGGITRRSGTKYVTPTKSSGVARLMDFQYSEDQAYILEIGAGYVRFFRNQGQINALDTGAAITNGTFDADVSGWTDNSNGTGAVSWDSSNARMTLAGGGSGNEAIAYQAVTTSTICRVKIMAWILPARRGVYGSGPPAAIADSVANCSPSKDAPPTRPPSTSSWATSSPTFLAFIEPP